MSITTIDSIKKQAQPQEVVLPGWTDEPVTFLLKRPSLLSLASQGMIPNSLLSAAQQIFTSQVDEDLNLKEISKVMKVIAKAAMVSPTYEELEENGIELTDTQITLIFAYTQEGLKAIEPFCEE